MTRTQMKQRLEELRSQARDKRRSAASRKQAAEQFRKLAALAAQVLQKSTPSTPPTPPTPEHTDSLTVTPAMRSTASRRDVEEDEDPWQAERRQLLEYLTVAESLDDPERIAYAREQLQRLTERDAEPGEILEPESHKPAENGKSDWQRNHDYWHGESVSPEPPEIKVDFAGGDPISKSLADLEEEQKRRAPFWERQAKWDEAQALSQAGKHVQPVRVIRSESDWPTTF